MKNSKIITQILLIALFTLPFSAFAGGGHSHGPAGHAPTPRLTQEQILIFGQTHLDKVVGRKLKVDGEVLDASWKGISPKKISTKMLKYGFTLIQMEHPKGKRKVFLLIDRRGELRDINHSGKFPNLN